MARGTTLKDEPIEYRKEQYDEKNMVLGQFGEQVSAYTMYEDIFGDMEQIMPIVIVDEDGAGKEDEIKHVVKMSIDEAIEQSKGRNDILMGGATYFKNFVSKATAKDIYTFIIDMDNVYSGTLLRALQNDWATENGEELPMPTYIVNSGIGLHLYFVLKEPIPNYKTQTTNIDKLYRTLAKQQTTKRVYLKQQVQWFGQDFRMAGGCGKDMWENTVFRVGEKWNADELAKAVGLQDIHFIREGENRPATSKKASNLLKKSEQKNGWKTNRAFYDYTLRVVKERAVEGYRYTTMCALAVIAWKCEGVTREELEQDLLSLLPKFNKGAKRLVKEREVYSAMKMFNEKASDTPRARLEDWLVDDKWKYDPIPRNGRKRKEHLHADYWINEKGRPVVNSCKQNRELALQFMRDNGEIKGRPKGSGSAEQVVREWQEAHPEGRKADCIRETGLSKPTVYRWWK